MKRPSPWLPVLWCIAIAWSLVSLVTFRSSERHGPDVVGEEVSGFIIPLLVALAIGIAMLFTGRGRSTHSAPRWSLGLATIAIGVAEVILYCTVVVR